MYHSLRVELFELLELLDPEPFKQHFDSLKSIEFVRAHRADLPSYLNIHASIIKQNYIILFVVEK